MAQFAWSDQATILLTDDDDDSSENEVYSRPEPETESTSTRRPMIGRRERSRDGGNDQSNESFRFGVRNGKGRPQDVDASESARVDAPETESRVCFGTTLTPTTMLILCLLFAAFPVHFPEVLMPDTQPTNVALRATVCLATAGAVVASLTSQLAFKMAAGHFRWVLAAGCVAVAAFAVVRCFWWAAPTALLGGAAFLAGCLSTAVRLGAMTVGTRPRPGSAPPPLPDSRSRLLNTASLSCGLLTLTISGLAPFLAASLHLILIATVPTSDVVTLYPVTSSFPPDNATTTTHFLVNTSTFYTSDDINSSSTVNSTTTAFQQSTTSSLGGRLVALSACYVVCSLGALMLTLFAFDDDGDRYRKEKSPPRSISGFVRLVLGPLDAFRRYDVALVSPFALFVGAQQMFAYFAYLQVCSLPSVCHLEHYCFRKIVNV